MRKLPEGPGLAMRYPGDRGIEKDPAVVFAEGFEAPSMDPVRARWESVSQPEIFSLSGEKPPGSGGRRSLQVEHVGGKDSGGHLYRRLLPGYDRLFVRFYVRFDRDCGPIHHFFHLGGYHPTTPYPQGGAGVRPRGDSRWSVGIEPFGENWTWDYYAYWCEMRGSPPRGQTWGNSFVRDPGLKVARGRWVCVETMVQMNRVGDTDGELALWIEGKRVSHLGKGFPRGKWVYDTFTPGAGGEGLRWSDAKGAPEPLSFPAGGLPFEGFRWRTDPHLAINYLWLLVYITRAPAGHVSRVWFDDIVVATEYIGPLRAAA